MRLDGVVKIGGEDFDGCGKNPRRNEEEDEEKWGREFHMGSGLNTATMQAPICGWDEHLVYRQADDGFVVQGKGVEAL